MGREYDYKITVELYGGVDGRLVPCSTARLFGIVTASEDPRNLTTKNALEQAAADVSIVQRFGWL